MPLAVHGVVTSSAVCTLFRLDELELMDMPFMNLSLLLRVNLICCFLSVVKISSSSPTRAVSCSVTPLALCTELMLLTLECLEQNILNSTYKRMCKKTIKEQKQPRQKAQQRRNGLTFLSPDLPHISI
jgi:hypothetical protein